MVLTDAGLMVRDLAQSMARYGGSIVREVAGHTTARPGACAWSRLDGIAGFVLAAPGETADDQSAGPADHRLRPWIGSMLEAEPDLYLEMTDAYSPSLDLDPDRDDALCGVRVARIPRPLRHAEDDRRADGAPHRSAHQPPRAAVHLDAEAADGDRPAGRRTTSSATPAPPPSRRSAPALGIASLLTFVATFAPNLVMLDLGPWATRCCSCATTAASRTSGE